jgi:hypothetical protein
VPTKPAVTSESRAWEFVNFGKSEKRWDFTPDFESILKNIWKIKIFYKFSEKKSSMF